MPASRPLFRPEAIEQHSRGRDRADILAIDPTTTAWGFRLIVAALVFCVGFACVGQLTEYASGPAVVRLSGRIVLTAKHAALAARVRVMPGQTVRKGDVLVEFHAADEAAELAAATREFEMQLRKRLLSPDDMAAREALVSLRTRRELAKKRLAQQSLRAPRDGMVADIRVQEGQVVEAGMAVVELADQASAARVTALLPGRYRPYLSRGKALRFELDGFSHRAQELAIENVSEQVVGPAEAARYLGRDMGDAFSLAGPVVLVEAALPRTSFEDDGRTFVYAHGMPGKAESPVRTEPIAYVFVPALKQWIEGGRITAWFEGLVAQVGEVGRWLRGAGAATADAAPKE